MREKVRKRLVYYCKNYVVVAVVLLSCCMFPACSKKSQDQGKGVSSNLVVTNQPAKDLSKESNGDTIQWKDKELEALIREVIHKPEGEILVKEVEGIEKLCIVSHTLKEGFEEDIYFEASEDDKVYDIKDWSDLSYLKNLKQLVLQNNGIKDIGFLQNLTNITCLNLAKNEIKDYRPLSSLTSLHELYLGEFIRFGELLFLRDLPIEYSDIYWASTDYPFEFSKEDSIEGITAGNLLNTGLVTCDGSNLYTMWSVYYWATYNSLIQCEEETSNINYLDSMITEPMAKQWGCEPGDYINERVTSLNYYKDHIYYISKGTTKNTMKYEFGGTYSAGNNAYGIIKYNVKTGKKDLLTTELFQFMCVARNHIYGINDKNEFVKMDLDGKERELVVKEPCTFAYVNEEMIYYLTAENKAKLMLMKEENEQPQLILEGNITKPILQDDYLYYMDASSYLYRYDMTTKDKLRICEYPIQFYNLDSNSVYAIIEEISSVCRMNLDGSNRNIIYDISNSVEDVTNIHVIGDYLFFDGVWKIKKDGTECDWFAEGFW